MDIGIGLGEEPGPSGGRDQKSEEEYHYEVLSTDQIVQHMVESIKEVNSVIQVSQENYASFQFSMTYISGSQPFAVCVPPNRKLSVKLDNLCTPYSSSRTPS